MATDVYLFLSQPASAADLREAHAYGPSGSGFHTDLAIEIDPSQLEQTQAVAVVSGMARLILDPLSPETCTLVLVPDVKVTPDLATVLGKTVVVAFVYHNLKKYVPPPSLPSGGSSTAPWPEVPLEDFRFKIRDLELSTVPVPDRTEQLRQFLEGERPIDVVAGTPISPPSTRGGKDGWGLLGFEIVFVRNGLFLEPGWNRLRELVAPDSKTRRMDPMAFYARVQAATFGVSLAPIHRSHPLLTVATRRTLLEIRTAQDLPFEGLVDIQKGNEPSIVFDCKENRGIKVMEVVTGPTIPGPISYRISDNFHVFTELPSGDRAFENLPPKLLTAPDHWAVQALFMDDIDHLDSWFVVNNRDLPLPMCTANNLVTPLIDGVEVFRAYTESIRTLVKSPHYMYLAGWIMMDDFELIHKDKLSTMKALIPRHLGNGARVRVMLWKQPFPGGQNSAECDWINFLGDVGHNAQAVLDGHTHDCVKLIPTGTHHQKFLVVSGAQGRVAYCGGVDINKNRRDSPNHGAFAPYHDVHARIIGPAVADIERVFAARWNSHPLNLPKNSTVPVPSKDLDQNDGSVFVQVACTFPRRSSLPTYPFAKNGSFTPLEAFRRAIQKAEKFIYIEDQYLTPYPGDLAFKANEDPLGIVRDLRQALSRIDYLIMVIPNFAKLSWLAKLFPSFDGQSRYRRRHFINSLLEVPTPEKIHVFYLGRVLPQVPRRDLGEVATEGDELGTSGSEGRRDEIYCHSKVWIIDDVVAKIGSANCNRRSYTHDSEMDIVMVDGALSNGARSFAQAFRMKLWGEHLGMTEEPMNSQLEDHRLAREFWRRDPQPTNSHVRPYLHEKFIELTHSDWDTLVDPDGHEQQ